MSPVSVAKHQKECWITPMLRNHAHWGDMEVRWKEAVSSELLDQYLWTLWATVSSLASKMKIFKLLTSWGCKGQIKSWIWAKATFPHSTFLQYIVAFQFGCIGLGWVQTTSWRRPDKSLWHQAACQQFLGPVCYTKLPWLPWLPVCPVSSFL